MIFTLILSGFIYAGTSPGHSILDSVDPSFDPQIRTTAFSIKVVYSIKILPDGKILAAGYFNSYNRQPVGGLIRLNADGSLDTTFNNNLIATNNLKYKIVLQPDGKIVLYGASIALNNQTTTAKSLMRLNSDGTLDQSFNFSAGGTIVDAAFDSGGRLLVTRIASTTGGGSVVIRLNADGS